MILRHDGEQDFQNVYIYIADALRYQSVPRSLSSENTVIKTVSSSPVSCSAFPTMVTGLYPPKHGVHDFSGTFDPNITTIFDFASGEAPCHEGVGSVVNSVSNAVRYTDTAEFIEELHDIQSPFLVFDRDLITHSPYSYELAGADITGAEETFESAEEYWRSRSGNRKQVQQDYEEGARLAVENFNDRIDVLRERGLLESTLVVFTADHGEQLGEYGVYGHSPVISPESVYVPTIFYNDSVSADGEFMGHIDLLPTIASVMDGPAVKDRPGYDLFDGAPEDRLIFNGRKYSDSYLYGGWDKHGGHTFFSGGVLERVRYTLGQLFTTPRSAMHRRSPMQTIYYTLNRDRQFGEPSYSREEVKEFCMEVLSTTAEQQRHAELDEETKKRLQNLGYTEEEV